MSVYEKKPRISSAFLFSHLFDGHEVFHCAESIAAEQAETANDVTKIKRLSAKYGQAVKTAAVTDNLSVDRIVNKNAPVNTNLSENAKKFLQHQKKQAKISARKDARTK